MHSKRKTVDLDDRPLIKGAYFPEDSRYQDHLKLAGDTDTVRIYSPAYHPIYVLTSPQKSTCASLNVVVMQNPSKFKNMTVTGVVSTRCGRHDLSLYQATADLHRGERYDVEHYSAPTCHSHALDRFANADFVLARSLDAYPDYSFLLVTYDIACQYVKHIETPFAKHSPRLVEAVRNALYAIGKLHVQGHKDDCQYRYSLSYFYGAGRLGGETIETDWAELNRLAPSTREMGPGMRKDVINDHLNDINWRRVKNMGKRFRLVSGHVV